MRNWTLKKVLEVGKQFLKSQNIRYRFIKHKGNDNRSWGFAIPCDEFITVEFHRNSRPATVAAVLMHEFYHIDCYRRGKFKVYHSEIERCGLRELKIYVRTALKAERYVDNLAKENFKSLYPGLRYVVAYESQDDVDDLKEYQLIPVLARINYLKKLKLKKQRKQAA